MEVPEGMSHADFAKEIAAIADFFECSQDEVTEIIHRKYFDVIDRCALLVLTNPFLTQMHLMEVVLKYENLSTRERVFISYKLGTVPTEVLALRGAMLRVKGLDK